MKFRNKISKVFTIALLLSLGVLALISQTKASTDEAQVVSEAEVATDELPAETKTSSEETFSEAETQELKLMLNPRLIELGLDTPSFLDSNGSILIPEDGTLLDICLPESLGEDTLNIIAPGAFSGTSCLRSIALPASIREIGQNAFADCPSLEYIVLLDRFDLGGMNLGENWSGDATIVFGLVQEQAPSVESIEENVESSESEQELPSASTSEPVDIDETSSEETEDVVLEDANAE